MNEQIAGVLLEKEVEPVPSLPDSEIVVVTSPTLSVDGKVLKIID
jgi:hypothetical protein